MPNERRSAEGLRVAALLVAWLAAFGAVVASWVLVAADPPDVRALGWLLLGVAIGYAIRR